MLHQAQLRARRISCALKEVVSARNPDEPLRLWDALKDAFQDITRPILIVIATDEKLGPGTLRQESVCVVSALGAHRQSETNQPLHSRVSAAGPHPNVRAERKTREDNRSIEIVFHPIQCGLDVVLLADALIVRTFTKANAAKVEAKHRKAEGRERLHRVVDDLVVHRSAPMRVWVADQRGVGSVVAAGIQKGLQTALPDREDRRSI